jgi:hypothetical protein
MVTKAVPLRAPDGRFLRGFPKPGNSGRSKGTGNRITQSVRDAFKEAFDRRGGVNALLAWAEKSIETETEFYRLCAKLIPAEITGPHGGAIVLDSKERQRLTDEILAACEEADG